MPEKDCQQLLPESPKVYLIVHELFGVFVGAQKITLVTPFVSGEMAAHSAKMPGHVYKLSRFKSGTWGADQHMQEGETYSLSGVAKRNKCATALPCRAEMSPHPNGNFSLSTSHRPFCTWELPIPKNIHQLRTVAIPDVCRPLFSGDPHGDAVDAQLKAIALVHVFEYDKLPDTKVQISDRRGKAVNIECDVDPNTNSVNLHLWAQLEDETEMSDASANMHAQMASRALIALFDTICMDPGAFSLSINNLYNTQVPLPLGIGLPELMTLAERKQLNAGRVDVNIVCTYKTCGHGGNIYVDSL